MFYALPVEAPVECEVRTAKVELFVDAAKKARVNLPPGASLRKCSVAREGAQVVTKPDSGGTTACVFYEFTVDPKNPQVQVGQRKTAVAKSLKDKSCPAIDFRMQSYPGKDWFFLGDNVPLENAYRVKGRVETGGLAFLQEEKKTAKDAKSTFDVGNTPLGVYAIAAAPPSECRTKQGFFQTRYPACYKAVVYNQTVRGGWTVHVALLKNGEYKFIESNRTTP
ncbi:MAG: hypothetical protein V4631_11220 [Pseudomonadota bacterium]